MDHGKQLELKLKELGLQKGVLADKIGVHRNTITQWLTRDILDRTTRKAIGDVLGLEERDIFTSSTYHISDSDASVANDSVEVYSRASGSLKKLDALKYCGLLTIQGDGLDLQRKWREEW